MHKPCREQEKECFGRVSVGRLCSWGKLAPWSHMRTTHQEPLDRNNFWINHPTTWTSKPKTSLAPEEYHLLRRNSRKQMNPFRNIFSLQSPSFKKRWAKFEFEFFFLMLVLPCYQYNHTSSTFTNRPYYWWDDKNTSWYSPEHLSQMIVLSMMNVRWLQYNPLCIQDKFCHVQF